MTINQLNSTVTCMYNSRSNFNVNISISRQFCSSGQFGNRNTAITGKNRNLLTINQTTLHLYLWQF